MEKRLPFIPQFKIAFTFTGEYRETVVRPVCEALLGYGLKKNEIFFDEWHSALFTGINADAVFRRIYHDCCECVVVLLSPNYSSKKWTGNLEWPTIRAIINDGNAHKVCLLSIDNVDINTIEGLYSVRDVAHKIDSFSTPQIACFLHQWFCYHILHLTPESKPSLAPLSDELDQHKSNPDSNRENSTSKDGVLCLKNNTVINQIYNNIDSCSIVTSTTAQTGSAIELFIAQLNLNREVVTFGLYPQTAKEDYMPIEWLVIDHEQNKYLLLSKYALDKKPFCEVPMTARWSECSLRNWLNNHFINNAFNTDEQKLIQETIILGEANPIIPNAPSNTTKDKVFLLNKTESQLLLSFTTGRKCLPTEFAFMQKTNRKGSKEMYTSNIKDISPCEWWLRSPGLSFDEAVTVSNDGSIRSLDVYARDENYVRPALWVAV